MEGDAGQNQHAGVGSGENSCAPNGAKEGSRGTERETTPRGGHGGAAPGRTARRPPTPPSPLPAQSRKTSGTAATGGQVRAGPQQGGGLHRQLQTLVPDRAPRMPWIKARGARPPHHGAPRPRPRPHRHWRLVDVQSGRTSPCPSAARRGRSDCARETGPAGVSTRRPVLTPEKHALGPQDQSRQREGHAQHAGGRRRHAGLGDAVCAHLLVEEVGSVFIRAPSESSSIKF